MAGQKIRGITIDLGVDATGIVDSIKDIDKEVQNVGKQLKDVDKLLKLDPTNTELLEQKTQLLQKQIENTKEKLDTLKQAQATMDANGVDKNSEQYQALQREIIATEQELKKLNDTQGSGSSTLATISEKTGQWGENLQAAGQKMLPVTAGLTALGAAGLAAFNAVDAGADNVIKKTGATGDAAEELEQSYKNVAKNIVGDWEDIGDAVGEVSTRFQLTGEDLEELSTTFLKFADINNLDVNTAVKGVSDALKTFNIDQSHATEYMGLLSKVSQDTGIDMGTLLQSLQQYGPTFKEMGLGLGSSILLMGLFESAGLDSTTMMSSLQKAAQYYNKEGKSMDDGLRDLIRRLQDSDTAADATAEAYEIFGKKGGQAFVNAAKEGKLSIDDLDASMDDYATIVDDTYQATLDGTDSIKLAWQNMQLALSEVGEAVGNTLAPIMEKITEGIQKVSEWFSNLDEDQQNTIVTIGLVVAAIGPLLMIFGKVSSGISTITSTLTATTGPIGIAIAAIGAVVGGTLALKDALSEAYKKASPFTKALEEIGKKNDDLAEKIKTTRDSFANSTTDIDASAFAAEELTKKLQDLIKEYDGSDEAQQRIQGTVDELNKLVPDLGLSWDSVTNSLNKQNGEILANIENMKTQAQVAALQEMYTETLKEQYEAEKNLTDATRIAADVLGRYGLKYEDVNGTLVNGKINMQQLEAVLASNGTGFFDLANAAEEVEKAFDDFIGATNNVRLAHEDLEYTETQLETAMQNAATATEASAWDIENACIEAFGSISDELQSAITAAQEAGVEIPGSLAQGIRDGSISVDEAAAQLAALTNKEAEAKKEATATAKAYTDTAAKKVADGSADVGKSADKVVKEMDISADAKKQGNAGGTSYNEGLQETMDDVKNTSNQMADAVTDSVSDVPKEMHETGDSSGDKLRSGLDGQRKAVSDTVDKIYDIFQQSLHTYLPGKMYEWGDESGKKYKNGLENQKTSIFNSAKSYGDTVENALSTVGNKTAVAGNSAGESFYNALSRWYEFCNNLAQAISNGIISWLDWAKNGTYLSGYYAGQGFYNGLLYWYDYIISLASAISKAAAGATAKALEVSSPSKVMMRIGEYAGEGLAIGLEHAQKQVNAAADYIANDMIDTLNTDYQVGVAAMNASNQARAMSHTQTTNQNGAVLANMVALMAQYMPYLAKKTDIVLDDGTLVGQMAPIMNEALQDIAIRQARG